MELSVKTGLKEVVGKDYFYDPTVLINITDNITTIRDESVGSIIGIQEIASNKKAYPFSSRHPCICA